MTWADSPVALMPANCISLRASDAAFIRGGRFACRVWSHSRKLLPRRFPEAPGRPDFGWSAFE